jgi:oxygen-dependent protoporphyrinogen oxidase
MKQVAIIGAGVSGLACAHRLHELHRASGTDVRVTVFESAPRIGGCVRTEARDGFVLEKGPDSFLFDKPWVPALAERLGIADQLLNTQSGVSNTCVVKRGRLVPMPEGFFMIAPTRWSSFAATPLFSLAGKARAASEMIIPPRRLDDDESVASFIRRRFGSEMLDRVGQPLVAGIHAGDPERLSARAAMPQFVELERRHGSVIRGLLKTRIKRHGANASASASASAGPAAARRRTMFVSFKGGMAALTDALAARLPEGTIRLNARVSLERLSAGGWALRSREGAAERFDAVCCAISATGASNLLRGVDHGLSERLRQTRFESMAVLNLAYRSTDFARPLRGFGFVVPAVEKRSITACTFSSQKFSGRAPAHHQLIRVFAGGALGQRFFEMDDADLKKEVVRDLGELLGVRSAPIFCDLARHARSQPQHDVGHAAAVAGIRESLQRLPGLHLTGSSYLGTGVSHCVQHAESEAEAIHASVLGTASRGGGKVE